MISRQTISIGIVRSLLALAYADNSKWLRPTETLADSIAMYKLRLASEERWIFISGEVSFDEPDAFIDFIKEYQSHLSGTIKAVPDKMQYIVDNDPLKLMFQWDSCFGITVVVPTETDITTAEKAMRELCDKLNQRQ